MVWVSAHRNVGIDRLRDLVRLWLTTLSAVSPIREPLRRDTLAMIRAFLLLVLVLLVATFPATWLLMLFFGNLGMGLSYWGTLPLGSWRRPCSPARAATSTRSRLSDAASLSGLA